MNVYMFEDNLNKQRHFLSVLDRVRQHAQGLGIDTELEPGFGANAENASSESVLAQRIFEALLDPNAIYLVDLDLTSESPQEIPFLDLLLAHDAPWAKQGVAEFEMLSESKNIYVREVCVKFPVALLIFCCCKAGGRSALLVSTDVAGFYPKTVQALNMVVRGPEIPFPNNVGAAPVEMIEAWAQALMGMLDELVRLSRGTSTWFQLVYRSGWQDIDGLPHDLAGMPLDQHKRVVKKILPWAPDSWWETFADASALHDCLKFSLGYHASWVTSVGEKALCLGGAYLLLLVAVAQRFPDEFMRFVVPSFQPFMMDGVPIPFLPEQYHKDAQLAVQALYDFYCLIRVKKSADSDSLLGIEAVEEPQEGCANFCVRLSWGKEHVQDFSADFSARISGGLEKESIDLPTAKAASGLIRFLLASCSRRVGVGSVGTIQISEFRECWIGWGSVPC